MKPDPDTLRHNLKGLLGTSLTLPDNYIVIDIETTGFNPVDNDVWQVGCIVNGVNRKELDITINIGEEAALANTFELNRRAKEIIATEGFSAEDASVMAIESYLNQISTGISQDEAINIVGSLCQGACHSGYWFAGHNFIRFDIPFLNRKFVQFGHNFVFPDRNLIDTGMLVKSAIMKRRKLASESNKLFYTNVANIRAKGVYYALDKYCIPEFNLVDKYNICGSSHDALFDCLVTEKLIEELVSLASE
jgi:DNA polymerase III epsilon subunit-like protein